MTLQRHLVTKPWGRLRLPPPFDSQHDEKIGEIWYQMAENGANGRMSLPNPLPLMVKYLFTSEKLSIQVHPSDEQAAKIGLPSGKEECWLVLDAQPDAVLGIGLKQDISAEALRDAALSGEIEQMVDWKPVKRGDFYYIPAGTIHAIGGGVSLIEVQQNADITYRLYDYGRPRELHLDEAIMAALPAPYDKDNGGHIDLDNIDAPQILVNRRTFSLCLTKGQHLEQAIKGISGAGDTSEENAPLMIIPLSGQLRHGEDTIKAGDCLALSAADIRDNRQLHAENDALILVAR